MPTQKSDDSKKSKNGKDSLNTHIASCFILYDKFTCGLKQEIVI